MTGGNTNHYATTDLGSKDRASRWSRVPCAAALLNARGRQYNRRSSSGPQQRRQDTAEKRNATWSTRGPPRNCFATLRRDLARQSVWWTHAVGFLSRRSAIRPAQHHRAMLAARRCHQRRGVRCTVAPHSRAGCVVWAANRDRAMFANAAANSYWAHGVVVSHPLRMRKALGSNPSVSIVMQDVAVPPCCFCQRVLFLC